MSEARERYYEYQRLCPNSGFIYADEITNYVTELEQQLSELKESQKQKQIIRLCNRLDKAEQQNKELREDRDNLMALISECIELDYFKDEAILILSDLIVKHSTK